MMQLSYPISSNILTHMVYADKGIKSTLRTGAGITCAQFRILV